uniref:(northern house mosquito) hypothetical protein n=1 Tax=Culex pipiens TaxID=7175 RepID=A0A8D8G113_CULPI
MISKIVVDRQTALDLPRFPPCNLIHKPRRNLTLSPNPTQIQKDQIPDPTQVPVPVPTPTPTRTRAVLKPKTQNQTAPARSRTELQPRGPSEVSDLLVGAADSSR